MGNVCVYVYKNRVNFLKIYESVDREPCFIWFEATTKKDLFYKVNLGRTVLPINKKILNILFRKCLDGA